MSLWMSQFAYVLPSSGGRELSWPLQWNMQHIYGVVFYKYFTPTVSSKTTEIICYFCCYCCSSFSSLLLPFFPLFFPLPFPSSSFLLLFPLSDAGCWTQRPCTSRTHSDTISLSSSSKVQKSDFHRNLTMFISKDIRKNLNYTERGVFYSTGSWAPVRTSCYQWRRVDHFSQQLACRALGYCCPHKYLGLWQGTVSLASKCGVFQRCPKTWKWSSHRGSGHLGWSCFDPRQVLTA